MEKTCFVISPIGEDASPTRKHADDVFDLIIQPAVEKFGFVVVRSDKIPGPHSIGEIIVRLVQEADLCIVDLTEHNPNVFYECGRRHENGKPSIQIIEKGQKIPFDLAGINTIIYELSDPRRIRDAVVTIQKFIEEVQKTGFEEKSSGASLTSISDSLARIERKIGKMTVANSAVPSRNSKAGNFAAMINNPQKVFNDAMIRGDLDTVIAVLPRIEEILGISKKFVEGACVIAINGIPAGEEALLKVLEVGGDKLDKKALMAALVSLTQYYSARDEESEGVDNVIKYADKFLGSDKFDNEDKAFIFNTKSLSQLGADLIEGAIDSLQNAIKLSPEDPHYHYNISSAYEEAGFTQKAIEAAEKCLALGGDKDPQHLAHAFELFARNGQAEKADTVFAILKEVDPARAIFMQP